MPEPSGEAVEESPREEGADSGCAGVAPWVGIVTNAFSGLGRAAAGARRVAQQLEQRGLTVRVAKTIAEREAVVRDARECGNCRALVVLGGDGTIAALVNDRPESPVAVLPMGTENLFARHFGFTGDSARLAAFTAAGDWREVDLGSANGRRFVLMAGFGFDAEIVTRHHSARLRSSGIPRTTNRLAYVKPVLGATFGYQFPEITVQIDDPPEPQPIVGTSVLVFNLPRYALGLPFVPHARDDDGMLDLIVFRKPGAWNAAWYLWLVFCGLHLGRRGVVHRQIRRARIGSSARVPVQLDGDPAGMLEPGLEHAWSVEALPRALRVLVAPRHAAHSANASGEHLIEANLSHRPR